MKTTCWKIQAGVLEKIMLTSPQWIDEQAQFHSQATANAPMIAPLTTNRDAIAALVVPVSCANRVLVNKVSLTAGLYTIQDKDRLEFEQHAFYISAECVAEETVYNPTVHSHDIFCFMTKARLREGEEITICPGQAGSACGMMFKRAAWNALVEQQDGFRCPNCSFDPKAPAWEPHIPAPRRTLAHLIRSMHQGAAR
jgi:hypothetical protein